MIEKEDMLLCNYVLFLTLETSLALPSTTAAANLSPALLASASVVIVAVVLVIHLMSLLRFPLPAPGRRGRRVVLALAAVYPKQVNIAAFDLQLTPDSILCNLHNDEHDAVALHMPLTMNLHTIWRLIVKFVDGDRHSHTLPLEVRHLWCLPVKSILGVNLLCLHLLHRVIPGNDASTALMVMSFRIF